MTVKPKPYTLTREYLIGSSYSNTIPNRNEHNYLYEAGYNDALDDINHSDMLEDPTTCQSAEYAAGYKKGLEDYKLYMDSISKGE